MAVKKIAGPKKKKVEKGEKDEKVKKEIRADDDNDIQETEEQEFLSYEKHKRTKLIQVKVPPALKMKAKKRARVLDMDLSEYMRFLLIRDIHGFS